MKLLTQGVPRVVVVMLLGLGLTTVADAPGNAAPTTGKAPVVTANGQTTFGIKPSHATLTAPLDQRPWFDYSATPGAQQPDYLALSNDAATPVQLSVYAADAFDTETGSFDVLAAGKKSTDAGTWITLDKTSVSIPARKTVVVPFTVRVPAKIAPGDHVAGIVASIRTYEVSKRGDKVAVDHRVGVRVYVRVQGPLDPRLAVTDVRTQVDRSWWNPFAGSKVTVTYTVRNPGNVRLGTHQRVTVKGLIGGLRAVTPADLSELLPGNSHTEHVQVTGVAPGFRERATVALGPFSLPGDIDGRVDPVAVTVHFWLVPWPIVAVLLLVLGLAAVFWRRRRKPANGNGSTESKPTRAGTSTTVGADS